LLSRSSKRRRAFLQKRIAVVPEFAETAEEHKISEHLRDRLVAIREGFYSRSAKENDPL
jgi:hypothetical protein